MTKFAVPDINRSSRVSSIQDALTQLDPNAEINTHPDHCIIEVRTQESEAVVLSVLNQLGFAANVAR